MHMYVYIDGLVQDCSISIANALEILQSCTKPSICIMMTLKTKSRQFDNFIFTGGTVSCHSYGATSNDKVIKLTTFRFQWNKKDPHLAFPSSVS